LDGALLTLSRTVNNDGDRCWGRENPHAVHDVSFIWLKGQRVGAKLL